MHIKLLATFGRLFAPILAMKFLDFLLKFRLSVPWLRVVLRFSGSDKSQDHVFYKSAIIVGKRREYDITLKEADFERIEIRRSGSRYFLDKNLPNAADSVVELENGDCIDLLDSKIEVNFGTISIPLYSILLTIVAFTISLIYFSSVNDLPSLAQYQLPPKREAMEQAKKSTERPKPKQKAKLLKTGKRSIKESEIKKNPQSGIHCKRCRRKTSKCRLINDVVNGFGKAKAHFIKGRIYESQKSLLQIEKNIKMLPQPYFNDCQKVLKTLKIGIDSYKCKREFDAGKYVEARRLCDELLGKGIRSSLILSLNSKLNLEAEELYEKAYMNEASDLKESAKIYERVLKIGSLKSETYIKSRARLASIIERLKH